METQDAVEALLDDDKAQVQLGRCYLSLNRPGLAIFWFRNAFNKCHSEIARFWMAWCFANGLGTERNPEMAKQYIERLIISGKINEINPELLYDIAVAIDGDLYTPDCTSRVAYELLSLAAAKKCVKALGWMAVSMVHDVSGWYRDDESAVRILYQIRDKFDVCNVDAKSALRELYLRASKRQIRKYKEEGIYDEAFIPKAEREPRYWLDGCYIMLKKVWYDSWMTYEDGLDCSLKGYHKISIDGIKSTLIKECLDEMSPEQLQEYYKSIGYNQETKQDIWTMIVVDEDGRKFNVIDRQLGEQYRSKIELVPLESQKALQ